MATTMLSPGVQVNVTDYSNYASDSSSTIIGIVGGARRGPVNRPTLITSRDQALSTFGDPSLDDYGMYALLSTLETADRVYYTRVVTEPKASTAKFGSSEGTQLVLSTDPYANGVKVELVVEDDSTHKIGIKFYDEETEIANLTGIVLDNTKDAAEALAPLNSGLEGLTTNTINFKVSASFLNYDKADRVELSTLAGTSEFKGGAVGAKKGLSRVTYAGNRGEQKKKLRIDYIYYDSVVNSYTFTLSAPDFLGFVTYALLDSSGNIVESFNHLRTDYASKDSTDYFLTYINNNSAYININKDEFSKDQAATFQNDLKGITHSFGINGIVNKDNVLGTDSLGEISSSEIISGLLTYDNPDTLEVDVLLAPGWSDAEVISTGISVCESRQDCIFIIDTPFGLGVQEVVDWSNCQGDYKRPDATVYNSSYAAIYWPWVEVYDSFTHDYIWLPPSGYVAAQYAYSEAVGHPWSAPAGTMRGKLTTPINIEYSANKGERDQLYGASNVINPIIDYKSQGLVIWGQKTTLRNSTSLNRVNVRRLVNYIKRVVTNTSLTYVFEPNDEYSWEKWVDAIDPLLLAIKTGQGVYDYTIEMDSNTVTTNDIENSRMPGIIRVKPTKAAEFIPINFMLEPYNVAFRDKL